MLFRCVVNKVNKFLLDHIVMIQLKNTRSLKDESLNYLCNTCKILIFVIVTNYFKKNFSKKEPVLISLCFTNQETLITKVSFSTNCDQELNDVPQSRIIVSLRVELLK